MVEVLNRSLFEDMVDAHWVIIDPETAEARYSDHNDHTQMLRADAVATFPDMYPERPSSVGEAPTRARSLPLRCVGCSGGGAGRNAAASDLDGSVREVLEVLAHQRDALTQLLAPGSPEDIT